MSGVVKSVKKRFRKSGLLGKIAIVAAVWFTAGTASAMYANPGIGLGQAMSASANSIWTTVSTGQWTSAADVAAGAGSTSQTAMLAEQTMGFEGAGAATNESLAYASGAADAGVASVTDLAATEGAKGIVGSAATEGGGVTGWMKDNPMAAVMTGNALSGAYGAYKEDKIHERETAARRERGLGGYDYEGNYGGAGGQQPTRGIVSSAAVTPQATAEQAINAPAVQQQSQQAVPVNKKNLTKYRNQTV